MFLPFAPYCKAKKPSQTHASQLDIADANHLQGAPLNLPIETQRFIMRAMIDEGMIRINRDP